MFRSLRRRVVPISLGGLAGLLGGCSSHTSSAGSQRDITRGLDRAEASVSRPAIEPSPLTRDVERPLALVNDSAITLDRLRPALLEAAGATALEEAALDQLLEAECRAGNVAISQASINAERDALIATLTRNEIARDSDEAERLLARLRFDRGLGDTRFPALLRRNAMLRALVAPQVRITPEAIAQARSLRYGPRYRVRLITTASLPEATAAARRIESGESFSVVAAEVSTDPSADRGGLLEPISPADPAYPAAVRSVLRDLRPGMLSQPIALDSSYALLTLDREEPPLSAAPSGPDAEAAAQSILEHDVRVQQERLLMNQLARRLLTSARITVLDRTLETAWRQRTAPTQPAH